MAFTRLVSEPAADRLNQRGFHGRLKLNGFEPAALARTTEDGYCLAAQEMAPRDQQPIFEGPILIDHYAFVGMITRIMPPVKIGFGAVVHANCELTLDVPPLANFGGVPRGRQIGWRRPRRRSPKLGADGRPGTTDMDTRPDKKH